MPNADEIQVLILLSLIPCVIAAMYSLTQVTEAIRNCGREKPGRTAREDVSAASQPVRRRF